MSTTDANLIPITYERLTGDGRGLGYHDGRAVFCDGPLPGETAVTALYRVKKRWAEGRMTRLVTPDRRRSSPLDDHSGVCAPWQGVDYAYQLELKRHMLISTFTHPDLTLPVAGHVPSPLTTAYRNKLEFGLSPAGGHGLELAFHARGAFDELVPTPSGCALGSAAINTAAMALIASINGFDNALPLDALTLREDAGGHRVAILTARPEAQAGTFEGFTASLDLAAMGLTGIIVARRRHGLMHPLVEAGSLELTETIAGVDVGYAWDAFFQVNVPVFRLAVEAIIEAAKPGGRVVDLYGGAGAIGLALARRGQPVTGIEISAAATRHAAANAARAGLPGYRAVAVAAEAVEADVFDGADTVVVDPPRAGLHPRVITLLRQARPDRIIYLSCNPATQSRDVRMLTDLYRPGAVTGFDFYPGTLHVESLLTLDRRG